MSDVFNLRNAGILACQKYNLNLEVLKINYPTFGTRNLTSFGPKM